MNDYREIGDLIYFISKETKTRMDEGVKENKLGQGQMLTIMNLMKLKDNIPISQELLAENMGINKGNISRNLMKLSENGFIDIIQDNDDKRKKNIILKDTFFNEFIEISKVLEDIFKDMIKNIREEDLLITLKALKQMKNNLYKK
ncbi:MULTISPECIES: MarR family winged helix-turn-helix transcriptional regulator [Clostridium]|uniref:Winged helix-turn-helix transcriptional regulator n=1 Tax=Clostridium senegalense TaxID=1465809 RepID=A0A6M0H8I3_9CLOT|nr:MULTISPECIES: MarR family winged helix-turn-helix transcriptional regulator [Clostridium]NEU06383.1 winged helix-turn-helix transcriptional regulator [Clostridium senegalense]